MFSSSPHRLLVLAVLSLTFAAPEYLSPSVFVEEIQRGPKSIEGVETDIPTVQTEIVSLNLQSVDPVEVTADSFFDVFVDLSVPEADDAERENKNCDDCEEIREAIRKKKAAIAALGLQIDRMKAEMKSLDTKIGDAQKAADDAQANLDRYNNDDFARIEPNGRTETTPDQMAREAYNSHLLGQWRNGTLSSQQLEQKWEEGMTEDMLNEWKAKVKKQLDDALAAAKKKLKNLNTKKSALQAKLDAAVVELKECDAKLKELLDALEKCLELCQEQPADIFKLIPNWPWIELIPQPEPPEEPKGWLEGLLDDWFGDEPPVVAPDPEPGPIIFEGEPLPPGPDDEREIIVDPFFDVFVDIEVPDFECPLCKGIRDEIAMKKAELKKLGGQVDGLKNDLDQLEKKLKQAKSELDAAQKAMDHFNNDDWARLEPNGRTETTADQMARAAYNDHLLGEWRNGNLTSQQLEQKWRERMTEDMLNQWKKKVKQQLQNTINKAQQNVNNLNKQKGQLNTQIGTLLQKIADCKKKLDELLKALEECEKKCSELDVAHLLDEVKILLPDPPATPEPEPEDTKPTRVTFDGGFVIPAGGSVDMGTLLKHSDQYNDDTGLIELNGQKYRVDGNGNLVPFDDASDELKIEIIPPGEEKKPEDKRTSLIPDNPLFDPPKPIFFAEGFESGDRSDWKISDDNRLVVSNIGSSGEDGVNINTEPSGWLCTAFGIGCGSSILDYKQNLSTGTADHDTMKIPAIAMRDVGLCLFGQQEPSLCPKALDVNDDGDVNQQDFAELTPVFNGPDNIQIPLILGGLDANDDVSVEDFSAFAQCLETADSSCNGLDFNPPPSLPLNLVGGDFQLGLQNGAFIPLTDPVPDLFINVNPFDVTPPSPDETLILPPDFFEPGSDPFSGSVNTEGDGLDLLYFGTEDRTSGMKGASAGGDDIIRGDPGDDLLGGPGDDIIRGDPGDDLLGGLGDDIIRGSGPGNDSLIGGSDPLFAPDGMPIDPIPSQPDAAAQAVRQIVERLIRDNPVGECEVLNIRITRIRIGTKVKYTITATKTRKPNCPPEKEPECIDVVDCDDGLYCNGAEICDEEGFCQQGEEIECNDQDECTEDYCNEDTNDCENDLIESCGEDEQGCDKANGFSSMDACYAGCDVPESCGYDGGLCWLCDESEDQLPPACQKENGYSSMEDCQAGCTNPKSCGYDGKDCWMCDPAPENNCELAHNSEAECNAVCIGSSKQCTQLPGDDNGCWTCLEKDVTTECPNNTYKEQSACESSCDTATCAARETTGTPCWECVQCPSGYSPMTQNDCIACESNTCEFAPKKPYIGGVKECARCAPVNKELPPEQECDSPTMELSVCEKSSPCDNGTTGECQKTYTRDDGVKCYSCIPKQEDTQPQCPSGKVPDKATCQSQCDGGTCSADDNGCYGCTVVNCPSGYEKSCPASCSNGCDSLSDSQTGVECYTCKQSCEDVCAGQGMQVGTDWSDYIQNYISGFSCVSGAHTSIATSTVGSCTCSSEPSITIDQTVPVCAGTPCGDVQCNGSASCPGPEPNSTITVNCTWGGWRKVDINQFVPQVGN